MIPKGAPGRDDLAEKLKQIKKQLGECRASLKESQALNRQLLGLIGAEALHGWKPDEQVVREYGWVYAWMYPLRTYLDQNADRPLTHDVRSRIIDITRAIIAQAVVMRKHGVELPFDPRETDAASFVAKQQRILLTRYEPCAICGEVRITHECHIIPRSEGGPSHRDNYVTLCPLHHHLFDHNRLSSEECDRLLEVIKTKMEAAAVYVREVRLPRLREYWASLEDK